MCIETNGEFITPLYFALKQLEVSLCLLASCATWAVIGLFLLQLLNATFEYLSSKCPTGKSI